MSLSDFPTVNPSPCHPVIFAARAVRLGVKQIPFHPGCLLLVQPIACTLTPVRKPFTMNILSKHRRCDAVKKFKAPHWAPPLDLACLIRRWIAAWSDLPKALALTSGFTARTYKARGPTLRCWQTSGC